jgi:hypothetical protein
MAGLIGFDNNGVLNNTSISDPVINNIRDVGPSAAHLAQIQRHGLQYGQGINTYLFFLIS